MKNIVSAFITAIWLCSFSLLNGQELIVYVVPPPEKINWESPSTLMRTTFSNTLKTTFGSKQYPIGHLYIGLRHRENGEELWTGISRAPKNSTNRKVIREGYGLGILFADIEGRLQLTDEVKESISNIEENFSSSYLRIDLSEENYQRLKDYVIEYDQRNYASIYNGLNKPRKGLGAGCAEFGMSFFEVAGIDVSVWKDSWSVEVLVPENLVGGFGSNRHISLLKILLTRKWASEEDPHFVFRVFEPYLMHQWIEEQWSTEGEKLSCGWVTEKNSEVKGLFLDKTEHVSPEDPIFLMAGEDFAK